MSNANQPDHQEYIMPQPVTMDSNLLNHTTVFHELGNAFSLPILGHSMQGGLILLVDDNDVLREGLHLLLEADGYHVVTATNGAEALQEMHQAIPDLILSDISMPEMDGYKFLEAVRARPEWVTIPFVFLTARGEREDLITGKRLGAEDYLVKPVNQQELLATVRSRLSRSQQLLIIQLQEAYESSLIMLANAIELRDHYTRGHVERVMEYTMALAERMGLNAIERSSLRFGAILHDIGKINIAENILSKPGRLTPAEWAEMKKHPEIGADLIRNIPYLAPALPVILYHHERWDGDGYPHGIAYEEIPLEARIVAVADSLDAMTTSRVYKEARDPNPAYQEILRYSGAHYDPQVVDALKQAWPEIRLRIPQPWSIEAGRIM